jgi:hypothetical protein
MSTPEPATVPQEHISHAIRAVRARRVLLDVAAVYGVATERLDEQVKCNLERFPEASESVPPASSIRGTRRNHGRDRSEQSTSNGDWRFL